MISIIVSSYKSVYYEALKKNIEQTVGVTYEIIKVDNPGLMGICEAYNKGASEATYDLLCFVHEDVLFVSNCWGKKVTQLFEEDEELALAGFAGSRYKSKFVTGWTTGLKEFDCVNISHQSDNSTQKLNAPLNNKEYVEVKTLDGVCLLMRRAEWQINQFNEDIPGFHFYDVDLSLRLSSQLKKVAVIFCVDLLHFSNGKFNDSWVEAAFAFHSRKDVQEKISLLNNSTNNNLDKRVRFFWHHRLAKEDISFVNRFKLFFLNYQLFKEYHWYKIHFYQFTHFLKKTMLIK